MMSYIFVQLLTYFFTITANISIQSLWPTLCFTSSKLTKQKYIIMETQNLHRQKVSFIIHLIERDDGNKKKQGLETIPTRPCV